MDLWPADMLLDERLDTETPRAILLAQSALLGQKTGNLIEGYVDTAGMPDDRLRHDFYITAPCFSYKKKLFSVIQDPMKSFPVSFHDFFCESSDNDDDAFRILYVDPVDVSQFRKCLRTLFHSVNTVSVIRGLLQLSRSMIANPGTE